MNRRVLVMLGAVLVMAVLRPTGVSAHAGYERSEPAKNAVLSQPPARVDVFFSEEVFKQEGRNFVRVFDEREAQVSEGDGVVDDDDRTHISATLPAALPPGRYVVRWMTTSDEDGDTDEGAFCFYVAVQPFIDQQAECAALAEEEEEATPTAGGATATAQATVTPIVVPGDSVDVDGDDAPVVAIVVGVSAGVAVLVALAGAAVWLRRFRG